MREEDFPHIVFIYPTQYPNELINKEIEQFKINKLNFEIKRIENEPYCSFEWIVPTAFGVWLFKPYFNSFLSEVGKDHYQLLKKGLKKLAEKGKQFTAKLITASQSTKKLSNNYNQSLIFSIDIQTKNNRRIKVLFDNDLEKEDWDNAIDEILDFVIDNYEQYPNDKLNKLISKINDDERRTIYTKINANTKLIEFFDDKTLVSEFKK